MTQMRSRNLSIIGEEKESKISKNAFRKMTGDNSKKSEMKKNSNKVPKNLRYDLENALLGVSTYHGFFNYLWYFLLQLDL